ncbi:MAG: DUF1549 domain-containing protein [Verrucomicrobiota bacterium]
MKLTLILAIILGAVANAGAGEAPVAPFENQPETKPLPVASGKIDKFVFGKLKRLGIEPANPCSDAVFVRRGFLDVIGTLPTIEETRSEDFVFRITVGEIPFVTSIFPLGGRPGAATPFEVTGWNLTRKRIVLDPPATEGIRPVPELGNGLITENTLFAVDALPVRLEEERNNLPNQAQEVKLPLVVNGRIDPPGDVAPGRRLWPK